MTGEVREMTTLREFRLQFARWDTRSGTWVGGTDKLVAGNAFEARHNCKQKYDRAVIIHCKDVTQN